MRAERGAVQAVRALEDEGARWAFGIPGTHTLELYDALARSRLVKPVLVTHELGAAFMADAVSRTSGQVGVVSVVPGAGVTHCLSGVAEALLDNVPLVVLACAVRSDLRMAFQLHDVDQTSLLKALTKAVLRPRGAGDIYACVRQAFALAREGCPGPVAVEIPAELFLQAAQASAFVREPGPPWLHGERVREAARLLNESKRPVLYAGNGARGAGELLVELAERLQAPAATTIQGKGVFPENHPLWLWNVLGSAAPPFARRIADRGDCLLAIGCRFSEVGTGSYGFSPPANLIHVDIDSSVFNRNYPAALSLEAEAGAFLKVLLPLIRARPGDEALRSEIAEGHARVRAELAGPGRPGLVRPAVFFEALQQAAGPQAIYVTDSGQGTFLAMEHLRLERSGRFIGPIDFSCMGYSVPAAIGAKLANPQRPVVAIAGDGALLMTGLELLTASAYGVCPVVCVLRDQELGQIAQFQRAALGRRTCTRLAPYEVRALAQAARCAFVSAAGEGEVPGALGEALRLSEAGRPVLLEVALDAGRQTFFTRGALSANLGRMPFPQRLRMIARAAGRRLVGPRQA